MAAQPKQRGKWFSLGMGILTMLVSGGIIAWPKLSAEMAKYPVTFEGQEVPKPAEPAPEPEPPAPEPEPEPAPPVVKGKPVNVKVEQNGLEWSGSIPRVK